MALMKYREANRIKWLGVRPAHDGTQIVKNGSVAGATLNLYTVTAGKTLFLTHANMGYAVVGAGAASLHILTAAPAIFMRLFLNVVVAGEPISGGSESYWPPIEIPALYTIKLYTSAAGLTVEGSIVGWEE